MRQAPDVSRVHTLRAATRGGHAGRHFWQRSDLAVFAVHCTGFHAQTMNRYPETVSRSILPHPSVREALMPPARKCFEEVACCLRTCTA